MKFIDFFAGVGGFRRGMELAGHECVGFCEFDDFATASYTSMHLVTDEQREYLNSLKENKRKKEILKEEYRNGEWYAKDIREVRGCDLPRADCWCFGSPCQGFSVAGKQLGLSDERSNLYFQIIRILKEQREEDRPQFLFMENVKNLLSINRGWDFARVLSEMAALGYDIEWQLLNSKDFGVPQNRERIFIIGHLRGRSGRKVFPFTGTTSENSIQIVGHREGYRRNTQTYDPNGIIETLDTCQGGGRQPHVVLPKFCDLTKGDAIFTENARCLTSRYDAGVQNKKGMSSGVAVPILSSNRKNTRPNVKLFKIKPTLRSQRVKIHENSEDISPMLGTMQGGGREPHIQIFGYTSDRKINQRNRILKIESLSPTITATDYKEPLKVAIPVLTPGRENRRQNGRRFKEDGEPMFTLTAQDRHGVMIIDDTQGFDGVRTYEDITPTLRSQRNGLKVCVNEEVQFRIRKLTPCECFRLQGWSDDYFEKAQFVNSDSQLYKQAGNGVTVNVIKAIAERLKQ